MTTRRLATLRADGDARLLRGAGKKKLDFRRSIGLRWVGSWRRASRP